MLWRSAYLRTRSTERTGDLGRLAPLHTAPATAATAAPDPKRVVTGPDRRCLPATDRRRVRGRDHHRKRAAAGRGASRSMSGAPWYHTVPWRPWASPALRPGEQARLLARLWKMVPLGVCRTAGHPPTFLRALLCARPWRKCLVLLGDLGSQAVDRLLEAGDNCFQLGDTLVKTHAHLATK